MTDLISPEKVIPSLGGDSGLDATNTDDTTYLLQLGYKQELRRGLGFFSSFAVQWTSVAVAGGLALSLGAGLIYVGPMVMFAWLIAAGFQMVVGVSVAEGVSAYPLAGGSYQIINRILGGRNPLGWQIGWWLIAAHIAAFATEAYGIAPFIFGWFGISIHSHGALLLWATVLLALSTGLNLVAVKVAAAFNNTVGVAAEFVAIGIVIVGVLISVITGHAHFHSLSYLTSSHGINPGGATLPFLFAMLVPVFVISGFDINGTAGEETEDAARTVPRALLITNFSTFILGSVMILFTVLTITHLTGTISNSDPIRYVMSSALGSGIAKVFEIMAVLSLFVNMMIMQLTAARVLWSQARDGQMPFPRLLLRLSKDSVPYVTVILAGVIGFLTIVYTGLLTVLLSMTAILWAAAYAVVVAVLMYAKATKRLPQRPFTTGRWWVLIDTIAVVWSVAICVILIKSNPTNVGFGFLGTIVFGLLLYYVLIPSSRRGVIKDVRNPADIREHEVGA